MEPDLNRGIISTADGILGQLLESPTVKDNIRVLLNNLDPDNSRYLVRTILWKDPEVILGLLGSLSGVTNILIAALHEMSVQIPEKFSPGLLNAFIGSILRDIDSEKLNEAIENMKPVIDGLLPLVKEQWTIITNNKEGTQDGKDHA